jgi:hypothetical protein
MADSTTRADLGRINTPALPRLAAQAGADLARPAKSVDDGLRAIAAWFAQHGDPFVPLDAAAFAQALSTRRAALNANALSNVDLVAQLLSVFETLHLRLNLAEWRDD